MRHKVMVKSVALLLSVLRAAVMGMIDWFGASQGLSAEEAYLLCSVAGDLRISEIVDQPHGVM